MRSRWAVLSARRREGGGVDADKACEAMRAAFQAAQNEDPAEVFARAVAAAFAEDPALAPDEELREEWEELARRISDRQRGRRPDGSPMPQEEIDRVMRSYERARDAERARRGREPARAVLGAAWLNPAATAALRRMYGVR